MYNVQYTKEKEYGKKRLQYMNVSKSVKMKNTQNY